MEEEKGEEAKDKGDERGNRDQHMGRIFWHKIWPWSKRLDQLSEMRLMFYSSQFPKCQVLWLARDRNQGRKVCGELDLKQPLKRQLYVQI